MLAESYCRLFKPDPFSNQAHISSEKLLTLKRSSFQQCQADSDIFSDERGKVSAFLPICPTLQKYQPP